MDAGERVGAILCGYPDGSVDLLGFGIYEGDHPLGDEAGGLAGMVRAAGDVPVNPRIRLDNGDVVWGCECWWGPEADVREMLSGAVRIRDVRIADVRANHA